MPHWTGAQLLDIVKAKDPRIEVIFLTAQDEASLAVSLMKRGTTTSFLSPSNSNQLVLSVGRRSNIRRLILENENYRLHLEQLVMEKTQALNQALASLSHVDSETLDALSKALDFRDQSTSGHSRRVADLTAGPQAASASRDRTLFRSNTAHCCTTSAN